jgi:hypothetical protein
VDTKAKPAETKTPAAKSVYLPDTTLPPAQTHIPITVLSHPRDRAIIFQSLPISAHSPNKIYQKFIYISNRLTIYE